MEKYSTYHIQTDGFEKILVGMAHMIQTVPIGRKCQIVIDYDPAFPKVKVETFIDRPQAANEMLWAFDLDEKAGAVTVVPMNGEKITIHGKREAEMFCKFLIECFQ